MSIKSKLRSFNRKPLWKRMLAVVLGLVTIGGVVLGASTLVEHIKDDKKTITPNWDRGVIDMTTGKANGEDNGAIYTASPFEAKGLEITLDFDSSVQYQVFFYDELDKYISCTETYTESAEISVPLLAQVRIMVTPIWGADDPLDAEISWYEIGRYGAQLEIEVDKDQRLYERDFDVYSLTDNSIFILHEGKNYTAEGFVDTPGYLTVEYNVDTDYSKMFLKVIPSKDAQYGEYTISLFIDREKGNDVTSIYGSSYGWSIDDLIELNTGDTLYIRIADNFVYGDASFYLYII